MYTPVKISFLITFIFLLLSQAFAADFDQDGLDDFLLIGTNDASELEWYAIDINDTARRSLGTFGKMGNHLASGKWSADGNSAKGITEKTASGDYVWSIDLPAGVKLINFGKDPEKVISGFDQDNNGAIDPVSLAEAGGKFIWKILSNPGVETSPVSKEITFGSSKHTPFYADIDGSGDRIGVASVSRKKILSLTLMHPVTGNVRKFKIRNYSGGISSVIPVAMDTGIDLIYILDKSGERFKITVIGDGVKIKKANVAGDEAVAGKYTEVDSEVLVVRSSDSTAVVINPFDKKTAINIDIQGILADDININTFGVPSSPVQNPPSVPSNPNKPGYPVCEGVQVSTDHLLYKPVSDTTGNVVLVFDSKYSREFVSVKLELSDGSFTDGWWKGLALWGNPDAFGNRQHWRTNVRSSAVKDNALIIANDGTQECRFQIPGSGRKRWE